MGVSPTSFWVYSGTGWMVGVGGDITPIVRSGEVRWMACGLGVFTEKGPLSPLSLTLGIP